MLQENNRDRRQAMGLLARADRTVLDTLWSKTRFPREARPVRAPETGLVTLRGRIGGGGAPFNFGEATVTRASVVLANGIVGHAYALGRDKQKATLCAICDALWQDETTREDVEAAILAPLRLAEGSRDLRLREETAATQVEFFTLVRGDD